MKAVKDVEISTQVLTNLVQFLDHFDDEMSANENLHELMKKLNYHKGIYKVEYEDNVPNIYIVVYPNEDEMIILHYYGLWSLLRHGTIEEIFKHIKWIYANSKDEEKTFDTPEDLIIGLKDFGWQVYKPELVWKEI